EPPGLPARDRALATATGVAGVAGAAARGVPGLLARLRGRTPMTPCRLQKTALPHRVREIGAMAIHHLFEQQALRTPKATTLLFGDLRVSYRELNHRATTLAHTLRHRGAGPNTLVGLLADRSVEMVAGILGILKA